MQRTCKRSRSQHIDPEKVPAVIAALSFVEMILLLCKA
jgi:hypothetical protein